MFAHPGSSVPSETSSSIHPHPMPSVMMDGELWIGRGRRSELSKMRALCPDFDGVCFAAFDRPDLAAPYLQRHRLLKRAFKRGGGPGWTVIPQAQVEDEETLGTLLDHGHELGSEGLMLHRADAIYAPRRTQRVMKLKSRDTLHS